MKGGRDRSGQVFSFVVCDIFTRFLPIPSTLTFFLLSCNIYKIPHEGIQKPGVVLVSTGILKFGQPSVDRGHVNKRNLNINADNNYAYAA